MPTIAYLCFIQGSNHVNRLLPIVIEVKFSYYCKVFKAL